MIPSVHARPALLGQLADLSRRDGTVVRPFLFSFPFLFFSFFFLSLFLFSSPFFFSFFLSFLLHDQAFFILLLVFVYFYF